MEEHKCPLCAGPPHPLDCESCNGWGYIAILPRITCETCKGSGRDLSECRDKTSDETKQELESTPS